MTLKLINDLTKKGLIHPPSFLKDTVQYLCITGSIAYGVSSNITSDVDMYGYCIPPKSILFPHTAGYIVGLDKDIPTFSQWQEHGIKGNGKKYDFSVFSILKYFCLVSDNNPNIIDTLFVPRNLIVHSSKVHELIRENRKLFLQKNSWHKFKGYAYSQLHKMRIKKPDPHSKRYESILEHGYDVKFAYHVVRLLNEIEQILIEGNLDLQRNKEQLKAIRRGEWTQEQVIEYFNKKEMSLEEAYQKSSLPYKAPMGKIKELYLNCLEIHFGSLNNAVERTRDIDDFISEMELVIDKYRGLKGLV